MPEELNIFLHSQEFLRILLEKGLLAAVLAMFGLFISRELENYKASLARQNEETKAEREALAATQKEDRAAVKEALADERAYATRQQNLERESFLQKERDERERTFVPRTQLELSCRFFGPEAAKIIADVRIIAENKGRTIRIFEKMRIRIFTFLEGDNPTLYLSKDDSHRLALQGPSLEETVTYGFTIEPGIRQTFPFTTLIDDRAKYILIKVDVETEKFGSPGSIWLGEALFMPVCLD